MLQLGKWREDDHMYDGLGTAKLFLIFPGGRPGSVWGGLQSQVERQRCGHQDHRERIGEESLHRGGDTLKQSQTSRETLCTDDNNDSTFPLSPSNVAAAALARQSPQHCEAVRVVSQSGGYERVFLTAGQVCGVFLFLTSCAPAQVCLVMEYAEGGSLYNGEWKCENKRTGVVGVIQTTVVQSHLSCSFLNS